MGLIDRDGVGIYYSTTGPGVEGPGAGLPLLLTHGYSATAGMWEPNLAALSARRPVITWDVRGHGRSDSPESPSAYSRELSVEDMAAVLDAATGPGDGAGRSRAVIGGLSLGGYLSLAFYLRYPARVAALVLCDCGPGYRRDGPRAQWNALAERYARDFETRGLKALGEGAEVRASEHRSAAGLALAARGILAQQDSTVIDSLGDVAVPTLVVVGSEDKPFLAAADVMASKIPGADKVVIDGAGHAANIDVPEAFNRAVGAFLDSIAPTPS